MGKKLFMETTEISAEKTAGEILQELVKARATQVNTEYKDAQIIGLRWVMPVSGQEAVFAMPARVEPVYKILRARVRGYFGPAAETQMRAKARRVAWRQLLRWVQAQMALIETGMVKPQEAFFAYVQVPWSDQSMFELFESRGMKALPAPERPQ